MRAGQIDAAVEDPTLYGKLHDGATEMTIPTQPGRWRSYYENIRDVLTSDAELAVKPQQVRRVMAVFDAAFRSAQTGQVIAVSNDAVS